MLPLLLEVLFRNRLEIAFHLVVVVVNPHP